MKETFRKNIEKYSDIAKEELKNDKLTDEMRAVIEWHIKNGAEKRATSGDTQGRIYRLQRDKQEIMAKLKDEIKKIDDPTYKPEKLNDQREVFMAGGKFYMRVGGVKQEITHGEIMTDGEWGLDYFLDPETVPRNVRKRYLIEKKKQQLKFFLDKQISVDAVNSKTTEDVKYNSYAAILEMLESPGSREKKGGFIAESMVKNFFKKLSYDYDLDIQMIEADVEQDVESKIDFVIRRHKHTRGVDVETSDKDGYENIGVQFTINPNAVEYKSRTINSIKSEVIQRENIYDLVLVSMPLPSIIKDFKRWKRDGRAPGGPDKNMPIEAKQELFEKVLAGVFTPEEIKERWIKTGNEWLDLSVFKEESLVDKLNREIKELKKESEPTYKNLLDADEGEKPLSKESYNWPDHLAFLENSISRNGVHRLRKDLFGGNPNIRIENLLNGTYKSVVNHYKNTQSSFQPLPYEQWRDMVLKNLKPYKSLAEEKEEKKSIASQWGFK